MDSIEVASSVSTLASVTSKSGKKTGRGRTKCAYMQQLAEGEKLQLLVDDGQPIGKNAFTFTTWLGTLARDPRLLPIDHSSWREVDKGAKDRVWKYIKSLSKKWRDYKCELKAKYYENCPAEDRYDRCPPNVLSDQWHTLIHFWDSEEGKKRSEKE